ncbi:hypothetical protein NI385_27750 (plasmid) [Vibrio parahaemolyticus]|uniref:hypothetical protein n=1 Tax=Vibrio parahaemolyticus TaxID=670 RepID=UPI000AB364C6|nr:hypothetical protein [Vibrio parahaemolyticus]MCS0331001.1 hypothetical protein [Vibrio diabolicus]EGQ8302765.1 hypothetical protein [Vibrio parahaemolyticus]EGQ8892087.1 hypothetical protein [Vibrio parahaemolyticus]EJG0024328.1 hypothetical protein [Vibrio parahaemolyticus]MBE4204934.1 hypothetical protein [Vibrio parahaemolyticus]
MENQENEYLKSIGTILISSLKDSLASVSTRIDSVPINSVSFVRVASFDVFNGEGVQ